MNVIRFEISNAESYEVNRLPQGIEGEKHLMMWKELCRTGNFTDADGVEHNINRAFLQNIVKTFFERKAKGIEVPCPVGHTHDPESKRGKVIFLELRGDASACSLYGIIEFVDEAAKDKLCHSNVSIEAPEMLSDGDGSTYRYGLEHVAFTDYPVVSGLEKFTDVVFSMHKEQKMRRKKFAEEAGDAQLIAKPDEDDKEKKLSQKRRFAEDETEDETDESKDVEPGKKLSKKRRFAEDETEDETNESKDVEPGKKLSKKRRFAEDEEEDDDYDDDYDDDDDDDDEDEDDAEEKGKKLSKRSKKFSLSSNSRVVDVIRQNRELKIEGLAREGKITPKQAEAIARKYCAGGSIRFSLDNGSDDGFEFVCNLASMNSGVEFGESTNVQFSNDRYNGDRFKNALEKEFQRKYGESK